MIVKAYAKINIAINLLGKREDGYHELDMIMLPLELHDTIEVSVNNAPDSYVFCDEPALSIGKYNLAAQTIEKARAKYHFKENFDVSIHKEIPVKAGLGGGSSNAAATLLAVLKLLKIKPTEEELIELSKEIGADVPYCLFNKPSRVRGIGEVIEPIASKAKHEVLLVKPQTGLATKDVFTKCDEKEYKCTDIEKMAEALKNNNDKEIAMYMSNALEDTAIELLPEIKTIKDSLKADGLDMVMMSGSGSSVFVLSHNHKLLLKLEKKYEKLGYDTILTKLL